MDAAATPALAAAQQERWAAPIDTGLRVSFRVYWYKLLHPLLERRGRFFLQGRQHRRYFVMPGDYVSGYTAKFGSFEAEEIAVARQVCRHGLGAERQARSAMVDLGCHIGNYSVELGPDFGTVVAVDAVQSYAHVARANLAWNGLESKSTVVCAAVSDREGEVRLQMERHGNLGHARVSQDGDAAGAAATVVPAVSLDALVQRLGLQDVSFIKFDVEGHEIAALQGALQTLRQHAPLVQVEVDKGHLPAVLEKVRQSGVAYEAWQVVRGSPVRKGVLSRLWTALRNGGNPVFVQKLANDAANARHLPCVLLVPVALQIDWRALFPVSNAAAPSAPTVPAALGPGDASEGPHPLRDVTAVVVTYNSAHCIASLAQSLAAWPHVIVVDNGSHDGTRAQVNACMPRARWIGLERNLGFGAANNAALAQVATPYALLINPDCLVETADAAALLQAAQRWPQAAVVVPQLVDGKGRVQCNYGWPRQQWASQGPAAEGPLCVGNACGAVMLLRLEAQPSRDWFDTRFFLYYEDEDLCLRLFQAEQGVVVEPSVRVLHVNRGSVRGPRPLKVEYLRGRHHAMSKILFTAKHQGEAAARRQRRVARLQSVAVLLLRLLLPSPKHLARACGRIAGFWQAPSRY